MKEKVKSFLKCNWVFIFLVVVLQVKSMMLLSMLRTPGSASMNFGIMYFTPPAIWAHIAIVTLIASFVYLFKGKGRMWAAIVIDILVTILFIADIWYYRVNGTFLSIRHIIEPGIFNPIGKSLFNFKPIDLLFLLDFVILFLVYKFTGLKNVKYKSSLKTRLIAFISVFGISAIVIGFGHYYLDIAKKSDKVLFRIAWAPFQTFSDISPLGYHGYDIYYYTNKEMTLTDAQKNEIKTWFDENKEDLPDNKYKGMFEGKNLIAIQVESLENFVIGQKVYGQEITPNINKLLKNSLYFDNIKEQNNSGISSDCDLMVNTSMLPVRNGSTFFGYPWTEYNTLQDLLNSKGYNTISTHPEVPGNWNWAEAHKSFKADKIWDASQFDQSEVIGLGMSDESYLKQIGDKLKNEKQPFYTFLVTLTSHGPFEVPEDKQYLNLPQDLNENMLGAYFQSVRYTDEAIGKFINQLKEEGLLENTVIMLYGDHCGVHKFYEDDIKDSPLEGDWWKDNEKEIPFMIYNPSIQGETISKEGGQIDFLPTIAYLLGFNRDAFDSTAMGRVLVNTNRNAIILNDGEIVGNPTPKEKAHLEKSFNIADMVIQGNYFKNN
ncbi:LTA synthase family protein [Clostridium perfringens]|uniref:LTA synthase family protein n=1 Tax=Clostridium perfringens TaxID=1502 RepID=UPI0024BC53ED|nr:LTA synthase family protein [Clostridium perfringens]MDK0808852.1 LTA synthase family protein [Clostridium perfringens]MDK0914143.1 LTA synthase family protein [Clostridium perfringens]MDK0951705.1 LTA synthase family protein [Clostridium perfringens]MDM0976009.1 LTA synthase family protein [Clostridium perfringens]MDZ4964888.1 sulfatase-like hydrolase/transferase [Clostridium perfringens]